MHDLDDELLLVDDAPGAEEPPFPPAAAWEIAIVDDDEEVHTATRYALQGFQYEGRPLSLRSAHSLDEAKALLAEVPGIACVLLDVVMGAEDAGLQLVRWIRGELGNGDVQIVLRTGQPGYAPELEVITQYAINDYKTKGELTRTKLIACITTALRAYSYIRAVQESRNGLEMIIGAARDLFRRQHLELLAGGVLRQICALLRTEEEGVVCFVSGPLDELRLLAAAGRYRGLLGRALRPAEVRALDAGLLSDVERVLAAGESRIHDGGAALLFPLADGRRIVAVVRSARPLAEIDRELVQVFAVNVAVSFENVNLLNRVRDMAYLDALTGLNSRPHFLELTERRREAGPFAMLLADVDHFQLINERLGHAVGDEALCEIARRFAALAGENGALARVAGNTFAFLAPDTDIASMERLFQRVRVAMAAPLTVGDCALDVGVTMAAVLHPEHGADAKALIDRATTALKRQKRQGRGEFTLYNPEIGEAATRRLGLVHRLAQALDAQEFEVHFQPKIGLRNARVIGAEALIRWRRPDGSLVPPGQFIPAVEDSGLILPVGEFVLYRSARWRAHAAELPEDFKVSVNVSMRQVMWPGFPDRVAEILSDVGCAPERMELEITESLLAEDQAKAVRVLDRLRGMGFSIALDDFGTGFSSLSYLQDLPIDVLKIDRAFIIDIARSPRAYGILSSVVTMARSLGLSLVAEGVETADQLRRAAECGCDAVQGFLFSPAVAEDQAKRIGPIEEKAAALLR
ncbi:EAL domain-containing protein [Azospirillum sp. TSO22-1]|uniref:GGDEF/EAL domain-containing response regulator n=1 Tax=Azospirillum sp. TSO22-1 TaxID=716789 RepID=UPI000D61881F|nr:EAL domain-containing protein [Azospirillum sp. TSO22-1]PWC44320.1 hypothetical protein TSO221_18060 [Azospirillum sp. TSO22-1]